jgi:hypothetical protein
MKFKSAVDWWFYAESLPLAGIAVVLLPVVLPMGGRGAALALLSLIGAAGLMAWLLFSTFYEVEGEVLLIRCGPFRWRIPIAEIRSVRDSQSVASSPALSLTRLQIDYGFGQTILVSPDDRAGFLKAIGREPAG